MHRTAFHVFLLTIMVLGTFAIGHPLGAGAQSTTPAASPGAGGPLETLVEAIIPAASIPLAPSRLFFLGHISITRRLLRGARVRLPGAIATPWAAGGDATAGNFTAR